MPRTLPGVPSKATASSFLPFLLPVSWCVSRGLGTCLYLPMVSEKLKHSFEELVKFTLHSRLNNTFGFQLPNLCETFCSTLLKDDPTDPYSYDFDSLDGVPSYPLYKRLASALLKCMGSGAFCRICNHLTMIHDCSPIQQKRNEWQKLIVEKGSEIVNILKRVAFELHIEEPFFPELEDGSETIEVRCASDKYNRIESGHLILINKCVVFEVQGVQWHPVFSGMSETERLGKVLPGVKNVEKGVKVYQRFNTEVKEQENGVLAISVSKMALQPYIYLASIISSCFIQGLSYEGIQGLLGLIHTPGTISTALPPPRSTLLASFNMPYKPNSSALTHGARALAKHIYRRSSKFWGSLDGNDFNKNRLAVDVVNRLIQHCSWLNVHFVAPHGFLFEIRVASGYGARWTEDGSKFIGFLEPYMQDGHSKGWIH